MRAVLAAIFISFACLANLLLGPPLGPFVFSTGLLMVCFLNLDLYTGRAGYYINDPNRRLSLVPILLINVVVCALLGFFFGLAYPQIVPIAMRAVEGWSFLPSFFMYSMFCGIIMFAAVSIPNPLAIILSVPLFIFCNFQHSIANAFYFGASMSGDFYNLAQVFYCALGNLLGSFFAYSILSKPVE